MPSPSDTDARLRAFLESLGANEGYAEELYRAYRSNPEAVSETWRKTFDALAVISGNEPLGRDGDGTRADRGINGGSRADTATAVPPPGSRPASGSRAEAPPISAASRPAPSRAVLPGDTVSPLRGAAARVALNMEASLAVPTATSQRSIPVRLLEENRRLLNGYLAHQGVKISFTPLIGWAMVRAIAEHPVVNSAYIEQDGAPARIERAHVQLGLAVDVESKSGGRNLLVPVVKQAEQMNFAQFIAECERLVRAARTGKLAPEDLQGATITLTNPGTLGTRASVPRLMPGQGAIIAVGAVAYPSGFEGMEESTLYSLGVGKVITVSCTYDHRVIQGAESGAFLARLHALLLGEDSYYEQLFADLNLPFHPVHWSFDAQPSFGLGGSAGDIEQVRKQAAVFQLVHAYRVRGHLLANVDPLGFNPIDHPELDPGYYGLTLWDLDRRFLSSLEGVLAGRRDDDQLVALRDIMEVARSTYCGTLACEFMHIQKLEQRRWLQQHMEPTRNHWPLAPELRRRILERLDRAEAFEHILHTGYVGHKRFSLEGGEALIPGLDHLLNLFADSGGAEAMIGMAHRGRLNLLANIVGQPMSEIFGKFEDVDPESVEGSGDVKYHIGAQGEHQTPSGKAIQVSVTPNPSHLEAVDPVLEGATRARQELSDDRLGRQIMPVLIHGDAAFAGQGVVAETLNLSQLDGYGTGGTIHIVVNNRIGFTTSPADARSTLYPTDVARMVQAPIFHVNGDDPDAVVRATELAFQFRQEFHKDVVIDLVCYRRHGHNEGDDPSLTQPTLYRRIEHHPSVRTLYAQRLLAEGVISEGDADQQFKQIRAELAAAPTGEESAPAAQSSSVASDAAADTAVDTATLVRIGETIQRLPESFSLHPRLRAFMERHALAIRQQGPVDWSLAEALAFGSLLHEGIPVRLTGQDSGRGTFSQRHDVLYDYQTGAEFIPFTQLEAAGPFAIYDTLLSEEAVLGFEFGYAMTHPKALVLWEAQFGDFVNGAQVVIDQFIAAAPTKWGRTSALVLLLPHGYEGQGPEHSSARPERFLQLCADNNLTVANCTTAAQYFHILRRQGLMASSIAGRRPLVLFTPKSLLRHPEVSSPFAELASGGFQPVLSDAAERPESIQRVVFCSGKVYYDLARTRREQKQDSVAVVRIEQLYPFPSAEIETQIARYRHAREWVWVQEEPQNMGAWSFMRDNLQPALPGCALTLIAREPSASPATGSLRRHQNEQKQLVHEALGIAD